MKHRVLTQVASLVWSLTAIALVLRYIAPNQVQQNPAIPKEPQPQTDRPIQLTTCLATSEQEFPGRGARLRVGVYGLTLIATTGPRTGSSATGILKLRPAKASDKSPVTGHHPVRFNPREQMLIGSAMLDFAAVAAPVGADDTLIPPPSSEDPVRPGVLVLMENWQFRSAHKVPVLLIGTLDNRRDEEGWLDGPGIGLWVRKITDSTFSGTWGNWGILAGGAGTFCARAI